jgi:hypothetical protein
VERSITNVRRSRGAPRAMGQTLAAKSPIDAASNPRSLSLLQRLFERIAKPEQIRLAVRHDNEFDADRQACFGESCGQANR